MNYFYVSRDTYDIYYFNEKAKLVIIGMSPGRNQTLSKKYDFDNGSYYNNKLFAFSGEMRKRLVDMLDAIGLDKFLFGEEKSCASLWDDHFDLVNHVSVLPQPVLETNEIVDNPLSLNNTNELVKLKKAKFISGINYKLIQNNNVLSEDFKIFRDNFDRYNKDTIFIALGPSVEDVLKSLNLNGKRIIAIPHPSGNNKDRVNKAFLNKDSDISGFDFSYKRAREYREKADRIMDELLKNR